MTTTGIIRRIDELGRIVIPKEIRKTLKFHEGEPLEIHAFKDEIHLKKYSAMSSMVERAENIVNALSEITDRLVLITDSMQAAGMPDGNYEIGGIKGVTKTNGENWQGSGSLVGKTYGIKSNICSVKHI